MKRQTLSTPFVCVSLVLLASCGGSNDGPDTTGAGSTSVPIEQREAERASAERAPPAAPAASASSTAGRLLASNCFGCHGTDGRPAGGFDKLAGESASEIIGEMREMRSEDEGIMTVHALGYTDEQVKLLAQYFASR